MLWVYRRWYNNAAYMFFILVGDTHFLCILFFSSNKISTYFLSTYACLVNLFSFTPQHWATTFSFRKHLSWSFMFCRIESAGWIHQQVSPTSWGLIGRNMFSRGVLPIAFVYNKQGQVSGRVWAGWHDRRFGRSFHYLARHCELLIKLHCEALGKLKWYCESRKC